MSRIIKVASWADKLTANVVFVHGLGGHAYKTWQRRCDEQSFWPLWLAKDIEGLAVYTFSYDAASNWLGTAMPQSAFGAIAEVAFRDRQVSF
jgi:hypothetical protein